MDFHTGGIKAFLRINQNWVPVSNRSKMEACVFQLSLPLYPFRSKEILIIYGKDRSFFR